MEITEPDTSVFTTYLPKIHPNIILLFPFMSFKWSFSRCFIYVRCFPILPKVLLSINQLVSTKYSVVQIS